MFTTHKSLYDRSLEKTPEQIFVNSLRNEYELSPAASKGVLELAKECLFGDLPQTVGKQKFICASIKAKHGRSLKDQEKVIVELTLDGGLEDLDVHRSQGQTELRQLRLLRVTEEAFEQGGILTQEDIARLLKVTVRTIRRDIISLVEDGNMVHTRGYDHDIGRTLSHKSRIIDLYLSGYVYSDIMRRSRHSSHSIKRYLGSFSRLLILLNGGVTEIKDLSQLLGQSDSLTREYLKLFNKYKKGDKWPKVYTDLLDRLRTMFPAKKKVRKETISL